MPKHSHDTTREQDPQTTQSEDDWSKQVLPQLPANLQEQAMKFKAFERSRKISNASDLLRGLLAYVYTAHSFQHLSMWSVLLGIADVSANDWRKRLQKASVWLDWLLKEVLAISSFLGRQSCLEEDILGSSQVGKGIFTKAELQLMLFVSSGELIAQVMPSLG